jgi:PGF-pre-PGF domain-containing protein
VTPKATLTVDTSPIKAMVYVDGILWGTAPRTKSVDTGAHVVSFGDVLGYLTPASQTVVLAENETRTVTGTYSLMPAEIIENQSPTYWIPVITPEENATVQVENTAISKITIQVESTAQNVSITVQQLTDRPVGVVTAAPGTVYKYLNIVAENITDVQIKSVTIRFEVEKSWMAANGVGISTIVLYQFDPATVTWTPLQTTYLSEDGTCAYFSAVPPGLSMFAVSTVTPAPQPFPWEIVVGIIVAIVIITAITIILKRR